MAEATLGTWDTPALVFAYNPALGNVVHVSEVSRTAPTDPRERAVLRALLAEALRLLTVADAGDQRAKEVGR